MDEYRDIQSEANLLCESRQIPMPPLLVQKVKKVYEKGLSLEIDSQETPLMLALRGNYDDLAWGYIQCAKQTNTNLHTGGTLDLQEFLGYRNSSGETAFHVAVKTNYLLSHHVISVMLKEVSMDHLISYRDQSGNTPISLLERDDMHHQQIINVMEAAAASKLGDHQVDPTTTHDKQQGIGLPVYTEIIKMDPNSRPTSHINKTRESLNKLDAGVLELTENKSTILHLVSELGDTEYAKDILKRHPSLIHNRNIYGETPFFVAASQGHVDMFEILISYANSDSKIEELVTRKKDRNTALHIAIQKRHVGVVYWLLKRIPQLGNHVNDLNESPLYLAACYKTFHAIVELILKECKEIAYDGPDGQTALHAAVRNNTRTFRNWEGELVGLVGCLLRFNFGLLRIQDMYGGTPLHYAAGIGYSHIIQYLLEKKTDYHLENQITSAFHIVDKVGKNMLHVAIECKKLDIIRTVFNDESLIRLISQKDSNGDTPLHLLMASSELPMEGIMMDGRFPFQVQNNDSSIPLDCASSDVKKETLKEAMVKLVGKRGAARRCLWRDLENEVMERIEKGEIEKEKEKKKRVFGKIGDNVVLVVTLIATATFAAAFTVPGGFDGDEGPDQGMPILLRKAAYKAFVVANALAFSCSCTVLFGHIRLQLDEAGEVGKDGSINIISLQYLLTGIAMVAMAIAFVTGTYVILTPSLGFAIPVCAMCLCIMVPLSIFPRKRLGFATAILRKFA